MNLTYFSPSFIGLLCCFFLSGLPGQFDIMVGNLGSDLEDFFLTVLHTLGVDQLYKKGDLQDQEMQDAAFVVMVSMR